MYSCSMFNAVVDISKAALKKKDYMHLSIFLKNCI